MSGGCYQGDGADMQIVVYGHMIGAISGLETGRHGDNHCCEGGPMPDLDKLNGCMAHPIELIH